MFLSSGVTGWIKLPAPKTLTMSFVGDCTIATQKGASGEGTFNWYAKNYEPTYFLEKVADIFRADDITMVNCENVLSDRDLTRRDKGSDTAFWFIGPASSARIFSSSSVEVAGFANNHARDYGQAGYDDTVEALKAQGLTVAEDGEPVYLEKNGIRVGILACGIWYLGQERNYYDELREMEANSDFQVVYPHGGTEGTYEVDPWRVTAFRNLIDHGADLVVGTHPHRIQPIERYNGGTIVYGLGNFCFGGNNRPDRRTAIYQCTLALRKDGVEFKSDLVIPCTVFTGSRNNWQPAPIPEDDPMYDEIYNFMYGLTESLG